MKTFHCFKGMVFYVTCYLGWVPVEACTRMSTTFCGSHEPSVKRRIDLQHPYEGEARTHLD